MIADWREHAECLGMGTDLFFPPERTRRPQRREELEAERRRVEEAKAVCARCIVRDACLKYAVENDLLGIYGGYTERERRVLTGKKEYNAQVIAV